MADRPIRHRQILSHFAKDKALFLPRFMGWKEV